MTSVSETRHGQTGRSLLFHSRGIAASRQGTAANCRGAAVKFEACGTISSTGCSEVRRTPAIGKQFQVPWFSNMGVEDVERMSMGE